MTKLDHHRGSITGIKVIQDGDILVTCSQDGTVCTWNMDNFTLLSTVAVGECGSVVEVVSLCAARCRYEHKYLKILVGRIGILLGPLVDQSVRVS